MAREWPTPAKTRVRRISISMFGSSTVGPNCVSPRRRRTNGRQPGLPTAAASPSFVFARRSSRSPEGRRRSWRSLRSEGPRASWAERRRAHTPPRSWSPDGGHIAFVDRLAEDGGPTHIALLSTATGLEQVLTQPPEGCGRRARRAATTPPLLTGRAFHRLHADDERVEPPRVHGRHAFAGADAPHGVRRPRGRRRRLDGADGSSLILSQPGYLQARLWRLPARGGDPQALNLGEGGATRAALSRQKDRLVFRSDGRLGLQPLARERAHGDASRSTNRLDASTRDEQLPVLSPDGGALAFSSDRTGNFGSGAWAATTGEPRR